MRKHLHVGATVARGQARCQCFGIHLLSLLCLPFSLPTSQPEATGNPLCMKLAHTICGIFILNQEFKGVWEGGEGDGGGSWSGSPPCIENSSQGSSHEIILHARDKLSGMECVLWLLVVASLIGGPNWEKETVTLLDIFNLEAGQINYVSHSCEKLVCEQGNGICWIFIWNILEGALS